MKRMKATRGSALMLVVVSALFLIILTGAAYTYLRSSGDTQQWTRERIQAKLTAESGANLAIHMILGGASIPHGIHPQWFLGTGSMWYQLPEPLGEAVVVVDPFNENVNVLVANAYEIRSLGRVSGTEGLRTFGFATGIMPENVARFSVFQHNPGNNVFIGDGFVFDGPYYANGPVRIFSESPTHENDPFFYSFTTTAPYYLYGTNNTPNPPQVTTPEYGNLQIQPINRHLMGEPWFVLNAEPIPFGSDELNWQSARNAAINGGLYLAGTQQRHNMRMVIRHDTLMVQLGPGELVTPYILSSYSNPVVWIENNPNDNVYLKGYSNLTVDGLSMAVTVGTRGNLAVAGSILYQNDDPMDPDNDIILGFMAVNGSNYIADPQTVNTGWDPRFAVATNGDLEVHAVMLSLDGEFVAERWVTHGALNAPNPIRSMFLLGGFMYQRKGPTAQGWLGGAWWGHDVQIYFDPRLMTMHPPYFPSNGRWHTLYWEEVPDMNTYNIMLDKETGE